MWALNYQSPLSLPIGLISYYLIFRAFVLKMIFILTQKDELRKSNIAKKNSNVSKRRKAPYTWANHSPFLSSLKNKYPFFDK